MCLILQSTFVQFELCSYIKHVRKVEQINIGILCYNLKLALKSRTDTDDGS